MLTQQRWDVEDLIMQENFPQLWPFQNGDKIGFEGWLRLQGMRPYQIVVTGSERRYPQEEPTVNIFPRPETHHWIPYSVPFEQRHLCYVREERRWSADKSTFASCVGCGQI